MGILCRYPIGIVLLLGLAERVSSQALGADCSSTGICDDTTNHVCENDGGTQLCKVQADGLKTDCAGDNANCPANAECATTGVCNCNAGWKHDGGGLCTVQDADCSSDACGDATNYVCESNQCKVQADGLKTDCAGDNANCPANAECATTGVCNCNAGWKHDGGGLCTVQDADCSSDACGDATNYVCESNQCKVQADGLKTDCASINANCPANAECATDVCNCNAGWIHDGSGLCTVQDANCTSDPCGDTTNYVCESNQCKVKADGSATSCASTDANCPANAACSTTTCSCNAGYTQATGLCTAIVGSSCSVNSNCTSLGDANTECSSGSCACVSGYTNAGGGACAQSAAFKLTASGLGVYLCILLIALLI